MPEDPRAAHDVIWKFPLKIEAEQIVVIDRSAKILRMGVQGDYPCFWAQVNSMAPRAKRKVLMTGTGITFPDEFGPQPFCREHIGTVQVGAYVWHYFWETT